MKTLVLLTIVTATIFTSCEHEKNINKPEPTPAPTVTGPKRTLKFVVERVFMGTPNSYSVMYKTDDSDKILIESLTTVVEKKTGLTCDWTGFSVTFKEVAADEPMEVVMTTHYDDPSMWCNKWEWDVIISIHNPKDVEGGTWQYKKKNGRSGHKTVTGQTKVIQ